MSPMVSCNLFLIVLILGLIAFQGYRMKILFKMGMRNVSRRKVNTMIVVLGLMIGTTIISGSLVVGDTLENMFTKDIYDSYDETDELVFTFDEAGCFAFFNESEYENLDGYVASDESMSVKIDGMSPDIAYGVSVLDLDTGFPESRVSIIGYDHSRSSGFGKVYPLNGQPETEGELGPGEIYINEKLAEELEAKDGHMLRVYYGTGEQQESAQGGPPEPSIRSHDFVIRHVVESRGRANYGNMFGSGGMNILMSLDSAQEMLNQTGKINVIKVSNDGDKRSGMDHSDAVEEELQPYLYTRDPILLMFKSKQQQVEGAEEGAASLEDLFMVLGIFTIIAGLLLIVNIFVMLAEERKSEMGMGRAVGMSQKQLMYMFLFEGTVYSFLAAAVGTLAGMGVAYLIILGFGSIFGDFNSLQYFTFTAESLVMAFVGGMVITLLTIFFASRKVSKLNIIRAIRNIPEPRYSRHEISEIDSSASAVERITTLVNDTLKRNYEIVVMILSAFLVLASFVDIGIFYNKAWAGYGGLALFIYGVGLLLRRYITDEKAFTFAGGLVLILWCYPYDIYDQLFGIRMEGNMEMFVLSGLFMVSAALMVVMYNSNLILNGLMKIFGRFKSLAPVFKTAISYPMDNRFRTGMTLAMFALIIFTITVLAMIIGLIQGNIDTITEENSGGYDMVTTNSPYAPIDDIEMQIDESENLSRDDFSKIVPLYTAYTSMYHLGQSDDEDLMNDKIAKNLTRPFP